MEENVSGCFFLNTVYKRFRIEEAAMTAALA